MTLSDAYMNNRLCSAYKYGSYCEHRMLYTYHYLSFLIEYHLGMQLSNIFSNVCIVFLSLRLADWFSICEISRTTIENHYAKKIITLIYQWEIRYCIF